MEILTPSKLIVQENTLEQIAKCPLMAPTSPSHAEICAYALASWALRKSFDGKLIGKPTDILHEIRGQLIKLWKDTGSKEDPGEISRTAGFKLFNLLMDYEVLHLEQPYNLVLTSYTIQGKYALLQKRKGACLPHVLVLHTHEPDLKHDQALPPDPLTLARYLHVYTTTKYKDVQVLHYPVLRGKPWMNKQVNIALAQRYLGDMLKVATLQLKFPIMGSHCRDCSTKPCLGAFKNE